MPEDDRTLPAELLEFCLAIRDADGLRPLTKGEPGPTASGWRRIADSWTAEMQPGDEVWTWSTPRWTWENLCGRGGLALVRDGKPVDHVMTLMN